MDFDNLTWREFEKWVEFCFQKSINPEVWNIQSQREGSYKSLINAVDKDKLILDYFITEKRRGGVRVVVDAKHYRKSYLSMNEIEQIHDYRVSTRSSSAIIVYSPSTKLSERTELICSEDYLDIILIKANRKLAYNLASLFYDYEVQLGYRSS